MSLSSCHHELLYFQGLCLSHDIVVPCMMWPIDSPREQLRVTLRHGFIRFGSTGGLVVPTIQRGRMRHKRTP